MSAGGPPSPEDLAKEVQRALGETAQIEPFSDRVPHFDLPMAYKVAKALRTARGERVIGHKIGFTNSTIWERYGVDAPMWGDMTAASVTDIAGPPLEAAKYCEPRIEPEVALKLRATPRHDMEDAALLACVEWFAPAFEIVQSIYPGWQFTLADCAAANALHGHLLLGPTVPAGAWAVDLPNIVLELRQNDELRETGYGHNVLGGPLSALRHMLAALDDLGEPAPPPGAVITTGTLTDAWPIAPGDTFEAHYGASPLADIRATFK